MVGFLVEDDGVGRRRVSFLYMTGKPGRSRCIRKTDTCINEPDTGGGPPGQKADMRFLDGQLGTAHKIAPVVTPKHTMQKLVLLEVGCRQYAFIHEGFRP